MDAGKMTVSINKAINTQEAAVKEKHARTCILGTHHEKGAQTFWTAVNRLPLSSNAVLCWKFCHVFHKLLRDGHPSVLRDSLRYKSELIDMSRMWGHLSEGYGQLCSIYLKLLIIKMEFHTKNPRFPGNLQMTDRQLDEAGENDVNNFFQLTVEIFDYMEWELNLFHTVFKSLDMSRSVSVTAAGQCRLSPLIQVILDCSHLYDYTVKLLFKLHSCLPTDTLQGHRDRFVEQFQKLKDLFYRSSNLQYFKRLLQIPQLPENPPNFLRASALSEHISPVVLIPSENSPPDSETLIETEDLVGMDTLSHQSLSENTFDDIFGSSFSNDPFNFSNQNGMRRDDKDHLIEQLYKEIAMLRDEFGNFKSESHRLVTNLKGRIQELEAELAEQKHLREQAVDENEFLRTELEDLKRRREDTEKAQRSLTEIERKSVANEQRYTKLKEKYAELVHSHADLLRKNAEVTKQVSVAREALVDTERSKKELEDSYQRVNEHTQRKAHEQIKEMDQLQGALESNKQEIHLLKASIEASKQEGQIRIMELKESVIDRVLQEAEFIIQESLRQLDEPHYSSGMISTDFLITRALAAVQSTEKMEEAWKAHMANPSDITLLLPPLVQFAHRISEVILQGALTPTSDRLNDGCRTCGTEALSYLSSLQKNETEGSVHCSRVTAALKNISEIAQELRPPTLDIREEELGDLVEKEMAATAAAVETAATRIEEMLNKSRTDDTGVKLQVNERILGSCTDLMQGIQALILASKDLQKEIVESGRGAASQKEFYARNSRWTEGLISASKAVGWGATVMVDAADLVVQGQGKFEDLIVCSHEIAASTAQLVAASKVKAEKDNANLSRLQQASKVVNQNAAGVVASTKCVMSQIEEKDTMDFSSMTLTQIKRKEMDSQVRVLELENELQKEREKLGELRKKHYDLAGVSEGWGDAAE
ncbi:huntingtin-interacting protein 1 [Xenopus tropicalis]|uniref:Huntingtin-interacting protein 1-related protein n=1 Tax=Xenopus tropicalis TaxID=8364 RepID=F6Y171_XENTR|nr:huntingtin-interacting protein 1 [Xenopus tropicalis]XP_004911785.1 huntingtin-interacting protein 1 [Xenopus tropicalis]XP_004911786.1 huntingtin-interacting protein 1 [Xenopus tropicalis]XP_031752633.1 huntingtin-interacting protein 1 [Xenopus tropicalis]|eukprot:XP_002933593.2 PREDICTED: huntingtin-interacting protein 1 [Xenopus tropicalis]